jgi:selenocysteine lyase/cysteine desulfurase
VAAAPALELLRDVGVGELHRHSTAMADSFREGVGLDSPKVTSAIVSAVADDAVPALLAEAKIVGSVRAGRLRLSFHLSTSEADVAHAVEVLRGRLRA